MQNQPRVNRELGGESARQGEETGVLLYDILLSILSEGSFDTEIKRLLERVVARLDAAAALLYVINKKRDACNLLACAGDLPAAQAGTLRTLPLDHPLLSTLMDGGDRGSSLPLLPPFDAFFPGADYLQGAPLTSRGTTLGAFFLCPRPDSAPLSLKKIRNSADQIAVVVEYMRLRREVEELTLVNERNRLARELHDSVTQSLYSLTLFAEAGERMLAAGQTQEAAAYLARVNETSKQALREMRLLVHRLRPSILEEGGLRGAVDQRLRAVEGRTGIDHAFAMPADLQLSPGLEETAFFIIQEALNNALKHAHATMVRVSVTRETDDTLLLRVQDDGQGFEPENIAPAGGLGLTSMRERAEAVGGRLVVMSDTGQGTTVEARLAISWHPADQAWADLI